MRRAGRPTVAITLTGDERKTLERWARRHSSSQALAQRCRIVLACAEGATNREIADRLQCHPVTVSKWRIRFAKDGLDGLVDAPRPGAQRTIADDVIEQVVIDTLESAPGEDTHWSTRGLAAKHGISHQTVAEVWRAFGLKPWKQDSFKVSPDPDLVEKIRDLVGLYLNPPVAAGVFAVDEKPQIQALNRTAPILPMLPTTPERASHDYQRNGTIDLFAALEIATGKVITDLRLRHTSADFVAFLNKIDRNVPQGTRRHSNRAAPNWNTVHRLHLQWSKDGTWEKIADRLRRMLRERDDRDGDPSGTIVDARSARGASTVTGVTRGYDAGKKISGRKTFGIVDTLGLLLAVVVVAGNTSDNAGGIEVVTRAKRKSPRLAKVWHDAGFKTTFRNFCAGHHVSAEVVNRIHPHEFVVLPRRWVIERSWSWLMNNRRLQLDYERRPDVIEGFIWAASSRLMLRQLAPT